MKIGFGLWKSNLVLGAIQLANKPLIPFVFNGWVKRSKNVIVMNDWGQIFINIHLWLKFSKQQVEFFVGFSKKNYVCEKMLPFGWGEMNGILLMILKW